jgi:hypothetical protein
MPKKDVVGSCCNPECEYSNRVNVKVPLKCGKCRRVNQFTTVSITLNQSPHNLIDLLTIVIGYVRSFPSPRILRLMHTKKACQKAHWSFHREFCAIWAETSENQGSIPIAKVKQKMFHLIWLVRSLLDYTDGLFRGYQEGRQEKGMERGYMEFHFKTFGDLFEAIRVAEKQPIVGEAIYHGMPGTPLFRPSDPGEGLLGQKIKLRKVVGGPDNEEFAKAVGEHMYFTRSDGRENLQRALDLVTGKKNMMVLSVSVALEGTYSTHVHDFLYRDLSWMPEN